MATDDFYAIAIPSWDDPRVVTTARNRRQRWIGTRLHPAYSWRGRVRFAALRARSMVTTSTPDPDTTELFHEAQELVEPFIGEIENMTVCLGPASPTQTATIELRRDGAPVGYLRLAETPSAAWRINHEYQILQQIPVGIGPTAIAVGIVGGRKALLTSVVAGRALATTRMPHPAQHAVSQELSDDRRLPIEVHPFLMHLTDEAWDARMRFWMEALDYRLWPNVILHGDLTPWNVRIADRTRLIDWEFGSVYGLPFIDLIDATFKVRMLIKDDDAHTTLYDIDTILHDVDPAMPSTARAALICLAMHHGHTMVARDKPAANDQGQFKRQYLLALADEALHARRRCLGAAAA